MKELESKLFSPIKLEEMEQVKLMNRTDTKYWFHERNLHNLLEAVKDDYFILHIKNETALSYATMYYDTDDNKMFTAHHNGKLNRYKIRRRSYVSSGISFLEVKFKTNKGRTVKKRIPSEYGHYQFNQEEREFLNKITPFTTDDLQPSLINKFRRITLVNKNFKERCTIDFNLEFAHQHSSIPLTNLVIVEIKAEGSSNASPLALALRDKRIKISGFSKYCIGRTVTDKTLKRNAFKRKIRSITKLIETEFELYN